MEIILILATLRAILGAAITATIFENKGYSFLGGLALGFFFSVIAIVIAVILPKTDEQKVKDALRNRSKRLCPNCQYAIPYRARVCLKCNERVHPPAMKITDKRIADLLNTIDKNLLNQTAEEYYNNAWTYYYEWQINETINELGKLVLVSKPNSRYDLIARNWLRDMFGFRD
ncbi:hypothetical protein GF380_00870 [Candidatus Uhrbacteria bacterium]|nr:hypothetical protein [Candidatus Uhrbacteria bacterium]